MSWLFDGSLEQMNKELCFNWYHHRSMYYKCCHYHRIDHMVNSYHHWL